MKNNKGLIVIIVLLSLTIIGVIGYLIYDDVFINSNNETNENKDKDESKVDTFSIDTNSGKVIVTGYVTSEKIQENLYDEGYLYTYFNILDSNSKNFLTFIENRKGNLFVTNNGIGIGCIEDNTLNYYNASDIYGMMNYKLSEKDTNRIMNSTKENPIKLELERLMFTSGSGAPNCYSHITNIKIVD